MLNVIKYLVLSALALGAQNATGAIMVQWDFNGNSGFTPSEPISFAGPNITGMDFHRGPGLNTWLGADQISAWGWGSTSPDDYFGFGFTVAPNYQVTLSDLQIRTTSSLFGPGTIGLYSSLDGYTLPLYTIVQPFPGSVDSLIDLSAVGPIQGTVEFRLAEIGNTSANGVINTLDFGTYAVSNFAGALPVTFNGTLSHAPEPSACLPLSLFSVWLAGRKRSNRQT